MSDSDTLLARAKFTIIGQEYGLQELLRAHNAHSRLARFVSDDDRELPFIALLAGPSGHGKSLLASKGKLSICVSLSKPNTN